MAPSLSQICVLSTMTMVSFALEAREERTGHEKILSFYSSGGAEIKELLDGSLLQSDSTQVSTLLLSFSRFWTSVIEIEVLNEEDCSLQSMLYCESLQKHIFLVFCNDFESHYCMFTYMYILLKSKTLLVLRQSHRPTPPILRYCSVMGTLKIHRKLTKIAMMIIFCSGDKKNEEISEKIWGLVTNVFKKMLHLSPRKKKDRKSRCYITLLPVHNGHLPITTFFHAQDGYCVEVQL